MHDIVQSIRNVKGYVLINSTWFFVHLQSIRFSLQIAANNTTPGLL